jgi:Isochorismatase family
MRLPGDATLLVIDDRLPQAAGPNDSDAEKHRATLLDAWLSAALPAVCTIRIAGDGEESAGAPEPTVLPGRAGARLISRLTASALGASGLETELTERGCTTLVVCGVATDGSVEATVRHAADLGYRIFVVEDACTATAGVDLLGRSWTANDVHVLALGRMAACGARLVNTRTAWIAAKSAGWGRRQGYESRLTGSRFRTVRA